MSALDALIFGVREVWLNGVKLAERTRIELVGRGWIASDNATTGRTEIRIRELAGGDALTNADQTLAFDAVSEYRLAANTLTAARTKTLSTEGLTSDHVGLMARIVREDLSAHDLVVVNGGDAEAAEGSTQKTLPGGAASVVDFRFNGTDWELSGFAWLA